MGPLTDIQDNIEKLRSLQESLHDLCTFISTLDLTSGAKEETLIHGITELKEAFANVDLSSVEQAITEVKNAVVNIDFSTLAKEQTLIDKAEEIKQAIAEAKPEIDTSELAKQGENQEATNSAIYSMLSEVKEGVENSAYTLLTDSEYEQFKMHMANVTSTILTEKSTP